jgi:DNA-binding winged helix-turn-helix (wHTH) protein/TolB-like protein
VTDTGIVDLAHTADFRLGDVLIRPARRQVVKDGAETELLQPRVMQVLIVLAEAKGAIVTREELTEACWRGRVVGDDAVNRVISRLRRLANTLGEGSFRIETVPKVGYRLETLTQGHATSTAESPPSQPATPARIQRRTVPPGGLLVGVLIILLGAGVWLWNADGRWPWSAGDGPLVAVAPFEAIGGGAAARELAKAVTGDAVSALGADSVQTVPVTSVSSAPSSAHLVLNGEIQQTRDDARVTLRLFDPEARAILWSGEVAGESTNVAERASLKAADMLTCGLKGFASKARLDAQARVLWLRTCDTWRQRGTLGQARDAMRVLMQRAPEFAGGYAKYALATLRMIPAGVPWGARAARGEARGAALHALKLDPNEADAYVALSLTEPTTDWSARERWLLMGLAHQPNSGDLINWEAYLLSMVGRIAEGLPLARRSVELDPHSAVKTVDLAARLYFAGETSEATKVEQAAELRWPESPDVLDFEFERAIRRGDVAVVSARLSSPRTRPVDMSDAEALLWPRIMAERHGSYAARGALANRIVDLVERGQFNVFWGVLALHLLREDDIAYAFMLKRSKGGNDIFSLDDIATVLFQPEMSSVRAQPRFMVLAANLGLTAYWSRSGRWPDFCSEPGLGYSCRSQARAVETSEKARSKNPSSSSAPPALSTVTAR